MINERGKFQCQFLGHQEREKIVQGQTLALKATVLEIPSSSTAEFLAIYVVMIIEIVGLRESNTNDLREIGRFLFESATHPRFSFKKTYVAPRAFDKPGKRALPITPNSEMTRLQTGPSRDVSYAVF